MLSSSQRRLALRAAARVSQRARLTRGFAVRGRARLDKPPTFPNAAALTPEMPPSNSGHLDAKQSQDVMMTGGGSAETEGLNRGPQVREALLHRMGVRSRARSGPGEDTLEQRSMPIIAARDVQVRLGGISTGLGPGADPGKSHEENLAAMRRAGYDTGSAGESLVLEGGDPCKLGQLREAELWRCAQQPSPVVLHQRRRLRPRCGHGRRPPRQWLALLRRQIGRRASAGIGRGVRDALRGAVSWHDAVQAGRRHFHPRALLVRHARRHAGRRGGPL
jgi:hypothetical protein